MVIIMNELKLYQFMNTITDNTEIELFIYDDKYDEPINIIGFYRWDYPHELNDYIIRKIHAVTQDYIVLHIYKD